jgi:RNA recognition motif-containing protein
MRGLPYDVLEKDIVNFFSPYSIAPGGIKIGLNGNRQRTGEAVVQFQSPEEARRAETEKDGNNIGNRWIELYLITTAQFKSFEM